MIDHFSDMKTKATKQTFGHISTPVLCTVRSWRAPTLASASVFAAFTIAMAGSSLPEPRLVLAYSSCIIVCCRRSSRPPSVLFLPLPLTLVTLPWHLAHLLILGPICVFFSITLSYLINFLVS
jgi:hypothetical protein